MHYHIQQLAKTQNANWEDMGIQKFESLLAAHEEKIKIAVHLKRIFSYRVIGCDCTEKELAVKE
jgi:hypothetical protein